jgi:hypothetical protein
MKEAARRSENDEAAIDATYCASLFLVELGELRGKFGRERACIYRRPVAGLSRKVQCPVE